MLFQNSIRQILRTPVKSILFVILILLSSILSTLGINLWLMSSSNVKEFEKVFTTIGTVEQKKSVMNKVEVWDAIKKVTSYEYISNYNAPIPLSALKGEEFHYLYGPEKRPFYGAYLPDYQLLPPNTNWSIGQIILEFTVNKDCVPDHEVEINIKKQLFTRYQLNTPTVWFCDRYNPKPDKLYAGKTYVMAMIASYDWKSDSELRTVFVPIEMVSSMQYTEDGNLMEDEMRGVLYEEVTEGFYDTEHGKRWIELSKCMDRPFYTVPVTPTANTNLLVPFYSGTTYINSGNNITNEEFQNGDKVCLVSADFAKRNNLKIGGKIKLPLYYANYRSSAGRAFGNNEAWAGFQYLNAKGKAYPMFSDSQYTIVGTYISIGGGNSSGYMMAPNEIIIPSKSVDSSDKDNIVEYGPMMGYTTSFQIPNGSIDQYKKQFQKLGLEDLELTFYDKGYSEMKTGIDNIKSMAAILLIAGIIASFLVLAFYCNLFIAKQKKRTAMERSLGMSILECKFSMVSGVVLIAFVGSVIGSLLGFLLTNITANIFSGNHYYSTEYTLGSISKATGAVEGIQYAQPILGVSVLTCVAVVLVAFLLSFIVVSNNLRSEPLALLSEKAE